MYALVKPGESSSSRQHILQENEIKKEPIDNPGDFSQISDSDEESVSEILSKYLAKRNIEVSYITKQKVSNKNAMEYINMHFVQSNFRTLGFHDPNEQNLLETWEQFHEFEEWLKELPENYRKQLKHIRFPLFCHLYLNLHTKYNIEELSSFLKTYKYLFQSKKSISFLKEILKIKETNDVDKIKSVTNFRKNKYMFYTNDRCYMCFCDFLENHHIIRSVFHEWFEVNYTNNRNHEKAVEDFFEKNIMEPIANSTNVREKRKLCETTSEHDSNTSKTKDSENKNHTDELNKIEKSFSNMHSNCKPNNNDKELIETSKESINTNTTDILISSLKHKDVNEEKDRKTAENNFRRSIVSSEDSTSDSNDSSPDNNPYLDFINNEFNVCSRLRNKFMSSTKKIQITKIDVKNLEDDIHLCNMKQIILKNCEKCTCAMLSADQKFVVAGSIDCKIYLWKRSNTPVHNKISIFDVYETDPIKNTDISFKRPSQNVLNETFDKNTAKILYGHSGPVFELGQIPRSNILMSVSGDASMRAWDMETGQCLEVFNGHNHRIWCLDICSTSLQLATGSSDSTACLWYINYKKPLRFYNGHRDDILCLKFHPNQLYLATGSSDKTVRLFNVVDAQCVRLLEGHGDFVNCLDFHLIDPCTLVSGDSGGGIIVWDLPSGLQKWKMYVGEITVADVKWLSNTILFASLASGIILKCDITRCYQEKSRKVTGFKTNYGRQINMVRIHDQFITIGLSGIPSVPKLRCNAAKIKEDTLKQEATQINSNPLKHLFFPPGVGKVNTSFPAYQLINSTQTPNVYQLNTQPMGFTTAIPQQCHLNKLINQKPKPSSFSTNQQQSQNNFNNQSSVANIQNTQDVSQLHKNLKSAQSTNQVNTHLVNTNVQQMNQPQYRLHVTNPQHAQTQSSTVFISQNSQLQNGTNINVHQINLPGQSSPILVSQQSQSTMSSQTSNSQQNNQKLLSSDNVPCTSPLTRHRNVILPDNHIIAQIERQIKKKTLNDQITSSDTLNRTTFVSDASSIPATVTCTLTSSSSSIIDTSDTQTTQPPN